MTKRPTGLKRLTPENLARLGVDRLAQMLVEMADDDPIWKRRLKMELAAEVSEGDLAAEIDKRLVSIAASRARVSWRKRPTLIRDLVTLRRTIVDRLAPLDGRLALDRLVGWFSLFRGLVGRVKDPKGELLSVFADAGPELGELASSTYRDGGAPAVSTLAPSIIARPTDWGRWLQAAESSLSPNLAKALLHELQQDVETTALRPVITRLADIAGDVDTWMSAFTPAQRKLPEVGAEIARRLVDAGRVAEARKALDDAQPGAGPTRWGFGRTDSPPQPEWERARIAVLEAEGRADEAQAARWAAFERDLSADVLREHISRLADFDDVEATEKAFAIAAAFPRFSAGLEFLMDWPALREAARMVEERQAEIVLSHPRLEEWAARLEARDPEAADLLRRRRR
jgi:hypothetical protein